MVNERSTVFTAVGILVSTHFHKLELDYFCAHSLIIVFSGNQLYFVIQSIVGFE